MKPDPMRVNIDAFPPSICFPQTAGHQASFPSTTSLENPCRAADYGR